MSMKQDTLDFAVRMTHGIWSYYIPVLICVGSIGNCLCVYVPLRTAMRRSSASLYIVALAVSDEGFLVFLALEWLTTEFEGPIYIFGRYCALFFWLTMLCNFLSAWFVVAFSVERFVAVRYPLHRRSICTVARARIILTGITCLGLVVTSPGFWIVNEEFTIDEDDRWLHWLFVFRLVNTIITVVVPFTAIAVLNVLIVKTLRLHAGARISLSNSTTSRDNEVSSHAKTTKMLLVVSSIFLCLNLPFNIMILYSLNQPLTVIWSDDRRRAVNAIQTICNVLLATSFGINFFLYCASGQEFRRAVLGMMACRSKNWSSQKLCPCLYRNRADTSSIESTASVSGSSPPQRTTVFEMS